MKKQYDMTTFAIREKLAEYLKVADDKKVKAVYTLLKDEMEEKETEYSKDFKDELNRRYDYYQTGGKMVTPSEADKQIREILKVRKSK